MQPAVPGEAAQRAKRPPRPLRLLFR